MEGTVPEAHKGTCLFWLHPCMVMPSLHREVQALMGFYVYLLGTLYRAEGPHTSLLQQTVRFAHRLWSNAWDKAVARRDQLVLSDARYCRIHMSSWSARTVSAGEHGSVASASVQASRMCEAC